MTPTEWKELGGFENYCFQFYGPNKIYGEVFNHSLSKDELRAAIKRRLNNQAIEFVGDSMDREIVRDIILFTRVLKYTKHDITQYFPTIKKEQ